MSGGPTGGPLDSELLERVRTEARRLVSLLHTQSGVSYERVRSTVAVLVELTCSQGVIDFGQAYKSSEASPRPGSRDPEVSRTSERASAGGPEPEEAPAQAPSEEESDAGHHGEQLGWLEDEQWSG